MIAHKPEEIVEMDVAQLESLLARLEQGTLEQDDHRTLRSVLESYFYVMQLIDKKSTTIARLRKLLFGATTEKTADVTGREEPASAADDKSAAADRPTEDAPTEASESSSGDQSRAASKKGHGRNGADDYPGAQRVKVRHASLQPGATCERLRPRNGLRTDSPGNADPVRRPAARAGHDLRIAKTALPSVRQDLHGPAAGSGGATEIRCDSIQHDRAAQIRERRSVQPLPRIAGEPRSSAACLDTMGNRQRRGARDYQPVHEELIRQAAAGDVIHNDDTSVKILERMGARAERQALEAALSEDAEQNAAERTGLFTSGVVADCAGRRIALFFSGSKHAGENLGDVLKRRAAELPPPIQMCDALSRNRPGG